MSTEPNDDTAFLNARAAIAHWRVAHPTSGLDKESADAEIGPLRLLIMTRLANLQEGERDPWLGRIIKVLVRKSPRYIVYLDEELEVRWWSIDKLAQDGMGSVQANVMTLTHASRFLKDKNSDLRLGWFSYTLRGWVNTQWVRDYVESSNAAQLELAQAKSDTTLLGIRRLIAESMAMLLNDVKREECEKVQLQAEEQILVAKDQLCRSVFFWEFFLAVVLIFVVCVAFKTFGKLVYENPVPGWNWFTSVIAGSFGAFLFATSRTQSLRLEPDSGRRGLLMEAYSRALIGAGAGLLTYFAFEAEVILKGSLKDETIEDAMRAFLCIASGWSERILPSLLSRAEGLVAPPAGKARAGGG